LKGGKKFSKPFRAGAHMVEKKKKKKKKGKKKGKKRKKEGARLDA